MVGNREKSSFSRVMNTGTRLEWSEERLEDKKEGSRRANYSKKSCYKETEIKQWKIKDTWLQEKYFAVVVVSLLAYLLAL